MNGHSTHHLPVYCSNGQSVFEVDFISEFYIELNENRNENSIRKSELDQQSKQTKNMKITFCEKTSRKKKNENNFWEIKIKIVKLLCEYDWDRIDQK